MRIISALCIISLFSSIKAAESEETIIRKKYVNELLLLTFGLKHVLTWAAQYGDSQKYKYYSTSSSAGSYDSDDNKRHFALFAAPAQAHHIEKKQLIITVPGTITPPLAHHLIADMTEKWGSKPVVIWYNSSNDPKCIKIFRSGKNTYRWKIEDQEGTFRW